MFEVLAVLTFECVCPSIAGLICKMTTKTLLTTIVDAEMTSERRLYID
jgi:hypothetical protein